MRFCSKKTINSRVLFSTVFLFFQLFFNLSVAQEVNIDDTGLTWKQGKIQLRNGKVVDGELVYDLQNDMVNFRKGSENFTFTAQSINSFFFLTKDSTYRSFITYKFKTSENFESPMFFEFLLEGKIPLLGRESYVYYSEGSSISSGFHSSDIKRIMYTHYILNKKGKIQALPNKRDLHLVFIGYENQMKKIIRSKRINISQKDDVIYLFTEYYKLIQK